MALATQPLTAEDLLRMPADGWRYELVQGELRRKPLPGFQHGRIANRIAFHLTGHVEANSLGVVVAAGTGFLLHTNPDEVRGADVAFISRSRYEATLFSQEKHFPGAPDLVVEVVSPSDSYSEVEEKVLVWLHAGARLVVLADPKKRVVFVHRPGASPEILTSAEVLSGEPVVPGWAFKVGDAFPPQEEVKAILKASARLSPSEARANAERWRQHLKGRIKSDSSELVREDRER